MDLTNDIYHKMGKALYPYNLAVATDENKKKTIDFELKNYIASKIDEINGGDTSFDREDFSAGELLAILDSLIAKEEKFDVLRHFIHYILDIAGSIQGFSIIWWVENDTDLIEKPVITFNSEGKWNELKTHEQTDYVKTFNFVYDTFTNNFVQNKQKKYS